MKRGNGESAFTLLELIVVVTLLTITIGFATVNVGGLSEQARIEAAATQIGSIHRLALAAAARSGMARLLRFDQHQCHLLQPTHRDGEWVWSKQSSFTLVAKVRIAGIRTARPDPDNRSSGPPWQVWIRPDAVNDDYFASLVTSGGVRRELRIDGFSGVESLEPVGDR